MILSSLSKDQVLTFEERINAVFPDIQFTMKEEENNQLAFPGVLICRKVCGGLQTKMCKLAFPGVLICRKMRLRLQPQRRPQGERLPDFRNQMTEKLENLHAPDNNGTLEKRWCQLRNVIQSTALEVLGSARHQIQD
ncbi:unnamed protein product [Schistocephalus solidus]|uniref:Uncharacterized protein n=1 Tax=Schistocephalus solidus TaxID=70667 RepID=A0A183TRJ6_SCHSO|nr:unnamed protein product [Schistocephalus solidus]